MSKFAFPVQTISDIQIQLRSSLKLNFVTEEDLTKPKSDTIKMIYTHLLMLTDERIDQDSFKPTDSDFEKLRFSDCQEISIPTIRLFKSLYHLFNRIGCKDEPFRLSDLVSPDFKRTRVFLSGLINFLRFITEELSVKMDENEDYVKGRILTEELRKLREDKERLTAEVEGLNKFYVDNHQLLLSKTEQVSELEGEKMRVLEERKKIEEKMQLLRIEIEGTEASIGSLTRCLEEAAIMQQTLESRIIDNPDHYISLLQEKKSKYQNLNSLKDSERSLTEETKNKISKMENIVSKVREVSVLLETIELTNAKYKELCRTLEAHKQEKLMLEKNCFERTLDTESHENDILRENSKKDAEKKNSEARSNSLKASIEAKRTELEYVMKQKQELILEFNEKQKMLNALVDEKRVVSDRHEGVMQQLRDEHERTVNKAELYSRKILELLHGAEYLKVQMPVGLMGK